MNISASLLEDCTFASAILQSKVASAGVTFFTDPVKYNSETTELKKCQMKNKTTGHGQGLQFYDAKCYCIFPRDQTNYKMRS